MICIGKTKCTSEKDLFSDFSFLSKNQINACVVREKIAEVNSFSSPEPTILLACGRNRELWEQPFRACAIDEDFIKPDGHNSVISFVISKLFLPELSIPAAGQKDRMLWGRE